MATAPYPGDAGDATERFGLGVYDGPALALVDETAFLRISGDRIVAAKFCRVSTGLGFAWRSYEGGSFRVYAVKRERRPA